MKIFTTYIKEKGQHQINQGLLWEYRMEDFDWQKYRKTVAERVISMGRLADWYAAFDLYGGIRQDSATNASGNAVATLFNGVCGLGYELLRYAYPETILSVL